LLAKPFDTLFLQQATCGGSHNDYVSGKENQNAAWRSLLSACTPMASDVRGQ